MTPLSRNLSRDQVDGMARHVISTSSARHYRAALHEKNHLECLMFKRSFSTRLRNGTSFIAISAATMFGAIVLDPALAQTVPAGIYGGGSTLASVALREIFDAYGVQPSGDTFSVPTSYSPLTTIEGLYAGVGSGDGQRAFFANDPNQLFAGSPATGTVAVSVGLPAIPPIYYDANQSGSALASYPYPELQFAAGDSPLASSVTSLTTNSYTSFNPSANWQTTSTISAYYASSVTYATGSYGQPVQVPLFEAPVAVAANLPTSGSSVNSVTWTINSQSGLSSGGKIQLSAAQICAIFSGLVTDWTSTATIPYLPAAPVAGSTTESTASFSAANTPGTASPYATLTSASASAPIVVVYRADGSGTSFIFTNYLTTVCPLIDPNDTYGYVSIFGSKVTTLASSYPLPNTSFSNLIARVKAIRGGTVATSWVGATGSAAVAAGIGTATTQAGYVGYLSNDFVQPQYSTGPGWAAVQNDYQRAQGVTVPSSSTSFIAPTPTSADTAWNVFTYTNATFSVADGTPATTWTYNDYNVYGKTFASGSVLPGGGSVSIAGLSALPLAPDAGAYPITGTTYLYLYSCYADDTVHDNLVNFLSWYFPSSGSSPASTIIQGSGFHALSSVWSSNIYSQYLTSSSSVSIDKISNTFSPTGCSNVSVGAN
jgi:ABC-type phosphate transport system substrate-binding protein